MAASCSASIVQRIVLETAATRSINCALLFILTFQVQKKISVLFAPPLETTFGRVWRHSMLLISASMMSCFSVYKSAACQSGSHATMLPPSVMVHTLLWPVTTVALLQHTSL